MRLLHWARCSHPSLDSSPSPWACFPLRTAGLVTGTPSGLCTMLLCVRGLWPEQAAEEWTLERWPGQGRGCVATSHVLVTRGCLHPKITQANEHTTPFAEGALWPWFLDPGSFPMPPAMLSHPVLGIRTGTRWVPPSACPKEDYFISGLPEAAPGLLESGADTGQVGDRREWPWVWWHSEEPDPVCGAASGTRGRWGSSVGTFCACVSGG